MIKINLAQKKQAAAINETKEKGPGLNLSLKGVDLELLKDPQIRKLGLVILVAILAGYGADGYKNDQLDKLNQQFDKVTSENEKAKADLAKTSAYDELKKQMDADEELIRTKLTTIQKLIADRQNPPKFLVSLAGEIPREVWLSEFEFSENDLKVKGSSVGYDQISDFMKALGENEFIGDVKLDNSEKAKDPIRGEVTTFQLEAKRK